IKALKDDDAGVRIAATQSLGVLKDGRAVEPIAKQIMDKNRSIRIASVTALGNIEEGRAAVLLQIALNDKDEAVRDAAAKALAKLTGQSCPLITGLSRFNITGFLWFIFLGFILVLPFIGSKIKSTSKWLDRISPNRLPQRIRWWLMLTLGLGALALYIYCFICKTELGAPIFALEKPSLLDVLWLYSFRVFPFFIGGCILSGWILRYFSGKRHLPSSMLGSTTLGAIIPLCSCAVIPMAMGMLRSKGTVRAVIAFLVATPILSPFIIILSYGIMGIAYTIIRIISVFLIAIVMGILIERTVGRELEDDSMRMVDMCKGCAMSRAGHNPSNSVLLIAWNQVSYLLKYMVIGLLIGALLEAYLPASIVLRYMSSNFLGLIASATVGIPIYLCSGQEVLILKPLMDMGLPMGHAMAFTIGANGICLTSIALLVGVIGRKTTIMMTALFWVGAIIIGYLINIAFLAV
ncbi:permease, partial [candidate division WOR-3 bacterium]|nr:permease [candidate division WOR-3 bacterium]